MNMNTSDIIERVKARAARLLDDCSENNRSLCNQKGTQSSYEALLKLVSKFEEGERSKKSWLAMQVLMETETSAMESRYDHLDAKEREGKDQLKRLSALFVTLGQKISEGEYHTNDMGSAFGIIDKILESILDMVQEVEALYPRPNKEGVSHLYSVESVVRRVRGHMMELKDMGTDSRALAEKLTEVAGFITSKVEETDTKAKGLGGREMHIDLDHKDVIEICQEIAQSI
jgi:hypothetical protein